MQLDEFILRLPAELAPLRKLAERLIGDDSRSLANGVEMSHRPKAGPEAYALTLFRPFEPSIIAKYQAIHAFSVSPYYAPLLSHLNGAHAFEFSLYGIPGSMTEDQPMLDRSISQPYDLATANRFWKREYGVPSEWFYFGGSALSDGENVGYFLDAFGTIHSAGKKSSALASWPTFTEFMIEELARSEGRYPAYEASMAQALESYKHSKFGRR